MVSPNRTFEDALVRQCAPTLAGLKPGSIFCARLLSPTVLRQKVQQWDERLQPFGISIRVLLERPNSAPSLVYVYRQEKLEKLLSGSDYRHFLERTGYRSTDLNHLLAQLARRLETQPEFPHEIGVFLGYPLPDVVGFIENRGRNFTCCGFWKSYSDPVKTQACFDCYRKCIHTYVRLFEQGVPIEKLAAPA